jgi:hypothetical protein
MLDNSADVFGGSENDRTQVRQFIGILRGLSISAASWGIRFGGNFEERAGISPRPSGLNEHALFRIVLDGLNGLAITIRRSRRR